LPAEGDRDEGVRYLQGLLFCRGDARKHECTS
jgi:hypothetical protein